MSERMVKVFVIEEMQKDFKCRFESEAMPESSFQDILDELKLIKIDQFIINHLENEFPGMYPEQSVTLILYRDWKTKKLLTPCHWINSIIHDVDHALVCLMSGIEATLYS